MFHAAMTFDLDLKNNALRDFLHALAQDLVKLLPGQIYSGNLFPSQLCKEMGNLGMLGVTVPEEFGGAGMSYLAQTVAFEEIPRVCALVSLSYGAHSNLCVNQIKLNGTDAQKAKYLPKLISGDNSGALAMSEAGAGSDIVSMSLRAQKRNDHYLITGNKYWITNGPDADTLIVYAESEPEAAAKGFTAFLFERDMVDFSTLAHFDKLGMRGPISAELIFDEVRVPFENMLGKEDKGVQVFMSRLDHERVVLAGIGFGIMAADLDEIMPYLASRKQFGQPIGNFHLMQGEIDDMYTAMNLARAYVYEVAKTCDHCTVTRQDAAAGCLMHQSKLWCSYTKPCKRWAAQVLWLMHLHHDCSAMPN